MKITANQIAVSVVMGLIVWGIMDYMRTSQAGAAGTREMSEYEKLHKIVPITSNVEKIMEVYG